MKNIVLTLMLFSFVSGMAAASGLQSANITLYVNGTLMHSQKVPPLIPQSNVTWRINATFGGLARQMSSIINSSQINYTDFSGVTSTAKTPLQITWTANPQLDLYSINTSKLQPVNIISSNIVTGTVSQFGIYSKATSAPACSQKNLYTEWDFQVTTQLNYTQSVKNVVVGRVCIYETPAGYIEAVPAAPTATQLSSTLMLTAGSSTETVDLNYSSNHSYSADGLVRAYWKDRHINVISVIPDTTGYYTINNTKTGAWYVQNNRTYAKWYNQYNLFALQNIPKPVQIYTPTSVGILSSNCGFNSLTNQSVLNVVQCMNSTAKVYYTQANYYTNQMISSGQNVSNYSVSSQEYMGKPAIAVDLPSIFVSNPTLLLRLNGMFLGVKVPAGKPAIISASSTSLNTFGIGTVITQVENIGNAPGLFNVTLSNCPGIVTPPGVSYQLQQGQGAAISTGIVAVNSSATFTESCNVVVTDLRGGGSASAPITVSSGPGEGIISAILRFLHLL